MCGGVKNRSAKDAILQVMSAIQAGHTVVGQDLSKCFDTVSIRHLDVALERLGAPPALRRLLEAYHENHLRIFSASGLLGDRWHRVSRGLPQGCPLSPLCVACIMLGSFDRAFGFRVRLAVQLRVSWALLLPPRGASPI